MVATKMSIVAIVTSIIAICKQKYNYIEKVTVTLFLFKKAARLQPRTAPS